MDLEIKAFSEFVNIFALWDDTCWGVPFDDFRGSTLPYSFDLLFIGGSFVIFGAVARGFLRNQHIPWWVAGLAFIVAVVCGVANYRVCDFYQVEFYECFIGNPLLFYLSSIGSIIVVIALSQQVANMKFLAWLGSSSLSIYAVHWIFTPFVCALIYNYLTPLCPSVIYKTFCAFVVFILITLLTLPCVWLIEKKAAWILGRKIKKL